MSAFERVFQSIKTEARSEAVFTESQIKQIIKIDLAIQNDILCRLEELKKDIIDEKVIKSLECEIESCKNIISKLIIFEGKEKEIMEDLRCQTAKNTHDIKDIETKLKLLEHKEFVDERVDTILSRLSLYATKKEIEEIERAIKVLAAKEMKDSRCDLLIQEIRELKITNAEQSRFINALVTQNTAQQRDIECLNDLIKRNTVVLSNEIHNVEKHIAVDAKVDMNQNTDIKFLQGEIANLKDEIQRLTNSLLVKDCRK